MIELKNSKLTYLGKVGGRNQYSLDCSLGAVQMRVDGGEWEDIDPTFKDGKITKAPYTLELMPNSIIYTSLMTGKVTTIPLSTVGVSDSPIVEGNQINFKSNGKVILGIVPFNTGVKFVGDQKHKVGQVLKQLKEK